MSDKQDIRVCWRKLIRYGRDGPKVRVEQYEKVNCTDVIRYRKTKMCTNCWRLDHENTTTPICCRNNLML